MNRDTELSSYLHQNIIILNKSTDSLEVSFKRCKDIELNKKHNDEESESLEAYTFRFARTIDIFTQKILKTIPMLLREDLNTFIDRVNFAEKINAIESADNLKILRDLRNEIAHDYATQDITEIYQKTFDLTPILFSEINHCLKYITENKLTGL